METIGYAVEFRNMHSAIHGLICFENERDAELAYDILSRIDEIKDPDEQDRVIVDVLDDANLYEEYGLPEIDWRDTYQDDADEQYYYDVTDDERVKIVNDDDVAIDLYM